MSENSENTFAEQIWQATLERLQAQFASSIFTTWFQSTAATSLKEGTLQVRVATLFAQTQLEGRFLGVVQSIVSELAGTPINVCFVCYGDPSTTSIIIAPTSSKVSPLREEVKQLREEAKALNERIKKLEKYTQE